MAKGWITFEFDTGPASSGPPPWGVTAPPPTAGWPLPSPPVYPSHGLPGWGGPPVDPGYGVGMPVYPGHGLPGPQPTPTPPIYIPVHPSLPIVIPPPGVVAPPIALPPNTVAPPIYYPPVSGGRPSHPIVLPPPGVVQPPIYLPPNTVVPPIYYPPEVGGGPAPTPPAKPDAGLPPTAEPKK